MNDINEESAESVAKKPKNHPQSQVNKQFSVDKVVFVF